MIVKTKHRLTLRSGMHCMYIKSGKSNSFDIVARMPHIHSLPGQYDHTVTLYIVRVDTVEPKVLLHMHRSLHRLLPFGGHVELHETPWQAAARELSEESGYLVDDLLIMQPKNRISTLYDVAVHPYPVVVQSHDMGIDHFHTDLAYAFIAQSDPSGEIAVGESSDIRWLTALEVEMLEEPDIFLNTKEVCRYITDICLVEWTRVPASSFDL
jgi:8-oxo-dGTP diphosphatase